jgi:hypothetical protein
MDQPKKKGRGRPPKFATDEERKAARQESLRVAQQKFQQQARQQKTSHSLHDTGHGNVGRQGLQIQFDPRAILWQAGPEGDGQVTMPDHGIQAEGLDVPVDEEQLQLLEVTIQYHPSLRC